MLEENTNNESIALTVKEESELNEAIDESLVNLPLDEAEKVISNRIIEAKNPDILQKELDIFNFNQTKKNALRIVKLNNLLDKVEDQAIERFEKRPDQVSNKELLDYMTVVSGQIDRSRSYIDPINQEKPLIKVNQTKTEVNVNVGPQLNRESKGKVVDAIRNLIGQLNNQTLDNIEKNQTEQENKENPSTIILNSEDNKN